ncbi:MAG: hypothetical protein JNK74_29290 [Candidatus Hydrogenedentes bacterium]|nr:hypothetical protein [Candidatus Hydrogenedentota bacterium]
MHPAKPSVSLLCAVLVALLVAFLNVHPRGLSPVVVNTLAHQGVALAFATMAQTLPVLTGGLDLSVGAILALANCVASATVEKRKAMGDLVVDNLICAAEGKPLLTRVN